VVEQTGARQEASTPPSPLGRSVLAEWLATPMTLEPFRSEVAVKLRGAAYGDRARLLANVEDARADHATRLAHYEQLERTQFPDLTALTDPEKDQWLVLRGGIGMERFWIDWLTEYLTAHTDEAHR
jgi:hypothetical protein